MRPVMVEFTQRLIEGWQHAQEIEIAGEMMALTAKVVARTLFNADLSQDTEAVGQAIATLQAMGDMQFRSLVHAPSWLPTRQNRQERHALQSLDAVIFRIINQRRREGGDKGDLLSMLLLAYEEDSDEQSVQRVRDEVISMFLAGHETTSNTLTWAWCLLSQHPSAAEKLHQELGDVLGGRTPTMQDIERLTYTGMIIRETLRLYPPVWVIPRDVISDVTIGNYTLKAGSIVVTSPYITHRHPRYYEEPEAFRPERFSPSYEQSLPRFAYFPFGGGPRICMGQSFATMEAVLILATIAQKFQLTLAPGHKVEMEPLITLRTRYGMRMIVEKRP